MTSAVAQDYRTPLRSDTEDKLAAQRKFEQGISIAAAQIRLARAMKRALKRSQARKQQAAVGSRFVPTSAHAVRADPLGARASLLYSYIQEKAQRNMVEYNRRPQCVERELGGVQLRPHTHVSGA